VPQGSRTLCRWQLIGAVAVLPFVVAGCASTGAATQATPRSSPSMHHSMAPGMSMADTAHHAGPSASALMVCSSEIREDVAGVLALRSPAPTTTSWARHQYTCTYRLPTGPLVLSVQDSTDVRVGRAYFDRLRARLAGARTIRGLASFGLPAAQTKDGRVIFLRNGKTLEVDARGLPPRIGPHRRSPADIAYAVAADVVGCWSE
jgi:hypothetical protein